MISARMRNALTIGTTVSIVRDCRRNPTDIERAAKDRERRSAGIPVERKHLLIERHRLRRRLIDRARDGIGSTQRELLQNVILECRSRNGSGRDNGKRNPNPLAIEEEKQFVVDKWATDAATKVVQRGARFVISWSGIREIVSRVELRAIQQLIEISMKLVRSALCDVVDMRRAV